MTATGRRRLPLPATSSSSAPWAPVPASPGPTRCSTPSWPSRWITSRASWRSRSAAKPTEAKLQLAVMSVLKQLISQHKRVIFDGDNYSEEWHAEAERRGLPNLKDSVAAFGVLRAEEEHRAVQEVRRADSGRARFPDPYRGGEVHQADRDRSRDHGLDGPEPDPAGCASAPAADGGGHRRDQGRGSRLRRFHRRAEELRGPGNPAPDCHRQQWNEPRPIT